MLDAPDPTRLFFLGPRKAPAEELSTVPVDFAHLFSLIPRVGRNAAVLYVAIRAMRQRAGVTSFAIDDLAWMLRARPIRIRLWMQRLAREGLLVYQMTNGSFSDVLLLEVAARPDAGRTHDLPTHWVPHVLPRLNRTGFLVYLWVRSHEWGGHVAEVREERLATDLALHPLRARFHLWRLRHAGLVVWSRKRREFAVRDPAPLSIPQQAALRLRELRVIPWVALQVALAMGVALTLLILHLRH
jgi:hypothetical protein